MGRARWRAATPPSVNAVDAISAITIASDDPEALGGCWSALGIAEAVRFVTAGERGEGIDGVDLRAVDRSRAGGRADIGGVLFTLV